VADLRPAPGNDLSIIGSASADHALHATPD